MKKTTMWTNDPRLEGLDFGKSKELTTRVFCTKLYEWEGFENYTAYSFHTLSKYNETITHHVRYNPYIQKWEKKTSNGLWHAIADEYRYPPYGRYGNKELSENDKGGSARETVSGIDADTGTIVNRSRSDRRKSNE